MIFHMRKKKRAEINFFLEPNKGKKPRPNIHVLKQIYFMWFKFQSVFLQTEFILHSTYFSFHVYHKVSYLFYLYYLFQSAEKCFPLDTVFYTKSKNLALLPLQRKLFTSKNLFQIPWWENAARYLIFQEKKGIFREEKFTLCFVNTTFHWNDSRLTK